MIDSLVHGRNRISGMTADEAGRPLTRPGGTGKFYRRYFVAIPVVFLHVLRFLFHRPLPVRCPPLFFRQ